MQTVMEMISSHNERLVAIERALGLPQLTTSSTEDRVSSGGPVGTTKDFGADQDYTSSEDGKSLFVSEDLYGQLFNRFYGVTPNTNERTKFKMFLITAACHSEFGPPTQSRK